ncbi:MAG TPA: SGNH/GDSL hydrolase family protein [Thermoanaerobaculia bacterium]|nr:SGNH/GDSL hydrolase family protein [Thermoanaerobaculia bacterium]
MNRSRVLAYLLSLALLLLPAGAAFAVNTGSADFTRYVSVGDSLTAGFTSASLVQTSQTRDYPALIAQQAGAADFQQPLVSAPGIPGILVLKNLLPPVIQPTPGLGQPLNLNLPRPYSNIAVPGETVHSLLTVVTDHGGLHDLILRGLGTQIQLAAAQKPTFVTLWIGNNDVLGAATSGVVIDGVTLTSLASFTQDYKSIVAVLKSTGAKMAFANIPDVTSIPFVTTIPPVVVNPQTQQPVLGPNGALIPIIGPNGPLRPGDHVLLSASADLAKGLGIPKQLGGSGLPLPDHDVLTIEKTALIEQRLGQFNGVIAQAAADAGAALVDTNALLNQLNTTGIEIGGIPFTSAFLTGGVFSYDGVHPTAFGYAFVANAFIAAINAQFGAQIPPVNLLPSIFGGQRAAEADGSAEADEAAGADGSVVCGVPAILTPEALRNLAFVLGWPTESTPPSPPRRSHRRL